MARYAALAVLVSVRNSSRYLVSLPAQWWAE